MIENEIQYKLTCAAAERFANALTELRHDRTEADDVHPQMRQAQEDAIRSELEILEAQMRAYELSRAGSEASRSVARSGD